MASCLESKQSLRALELFSGVGGMHWALKQAGVQICAVTAIDINPSANLLYSYNFPGTRLIQSNILGLTSDFLREVGAHLWLMSPPCQPFTRQGKKLDLKDERASAFMHILKLIRELHSQLSSLPRYILLENVQGFECSEARHELVKVLLETGYSFREMLLSPVHFGVPNSRLRYYLLAKLKPLSFSFESSEISTDWPIPETRDKINISLFLSDTPATVGGCELRMNSKITELPTTCTSTDKPGESNASVSLPLAACLTLDRFLTPLSQPLKLNYLLSSRTLQKYGKILDIVYPDSRSCCCFTRAYGHYLQGTGSVLQSGPESKAATTIAYDKYFKDLDQATEKPESHLIPLELRFFTPREVANIMCFPSELKLPPELSDRQLYRLLGNSVNVYVIGTLLSQLLIHESTSLKV